MSSFNIPRNRTQPWLPSQVHRALERALGYLYSQISTNVEAVPGLQQAINDLTGRVEALELLHSEE